MESWDKVESEIVEDEIISLARALITIPSYVEIKDGERRVAERLDAFFRDNGLIPEIREIESGVNIIVSLGGTDTGSPSLMFNGHLDTVPVDNMTISPFDAEIKEGKLYGRGSCDMKGGLACMAVALVALKRAKVKLKGRLVFTGVSTEEAGSWGTKEIIKSGPLSDCVIVGEPTNLEIVSASKGIILAIIDVMGKAAHGSSPELGINAIYKAIKLIRKVQNEFPKIFKKKKHPTLGSPSFNLGTIKGGERFNIVPDKCNLVFDRRMLPGETEKEIASEFQEIINSIKKEDTEFEASLQFILGLPPMDTPLDLPFIKFLDEAVNQVMGKTVYAGIAGSTDASLFSQHGIPSIVFGPGRLSMAHTANEHIEISQLKKAADTYALTALKFLS
ncbi:MAG: M20 family metallopeptidase [Candidatus Jordarchaeum sp.]|uniref:M20 family metallopeptidase n=1 Tax=Candidatus Jordarchaeum sp. TaxID=2823881 RepID=UPI0040490FE0